MCRVCVLSTRDNGRKLHVIFILLFYGKARRHDKAKHRLIETLHSVRDYILFIHLLNLSCYTCHYFKSFKLTFGKDTIVPQSLLRFAEYPPELPCTATYELQNAQRMAAGAASQLGLLLDPAALSNTIAHVHNSLDFATSWRYDTVVLACLPTLVESGWEMSFNTCLTLFSIIRTLLLGHEPLDLIVVFAEAMFNAVDSRWTGIIVVGGSHFFVLTTRLLSITPSKRAHRQRQPTLGQCLQSSLLHTPP